MKRVLVLNLEKEQQIRAILQPLLDQVAAAFDRLESFPPGTLHDDLHGSVMVISHASHSINTTQFRLHESNDLSKTENTINILVQCLSTELQKIVEAIPIVAG